jgi:hypothetical protein
MGQTIYNAIKNTSGLISGVNVLAPSVTKSSDPNDVTGGVYYLNDYLNQFNGGSGPFYADGCAYHGYVDPSTAPQNPFPFPDDPTSTFQSVLNHADNYRTVCNRISTTAPLYETEGSWGPNGDLCNPPDPNCAAPPITSDFATAWLARFYIAQASAAVVDNIATVVWYAWGNTSTTQPWGQIVDDNWVLTNAGFAYGTLGGTNGTLGNWLIGATPVAEATSQTYSGCNNDTVWTSNFTRTSPTNYIAQAVWTAIDYGASCNYTAPLSYTSYRDVVTNTSTTIPTTGLVPIGIKPVLLEGNASAVTVSVSPSSATLDSQQQLQFSATVNNTWNKGVTWITNVSGGSINSSGLFTAPTVTSGSVSGTVKATSQADTSKFGTASVTVYPKPVCSTLSITPTIGSAPQPVTATETCNGHNITSVVLAWGDGTQTNLSAGTHSNIPHTYGVGVFTATVTATDAQGGTGSKSQSGLTYFVN